MIVLFCQIGHGIGLMQGTTLSTDGQTDERMVFDVVFISEHGECNVMGLVMLMQPIWTLQPVNHLRAISSSMQQSTWKAKHHPQHYCRSIQAQRQAIPPQQTAVLMAVTQQHSRTRDSHPTSLLAAKAAGTLWTHWQLQTSFSRQCQDGVLRMPYAINLQPSTLARLSKECQPHQLLICLSQRREWPQVIAAGPVSLTVSAYPPDQMRQRGSIREATICQCLPILAGLSSALAPAGCRQLPPSKLGQGAMLRSGTLTYLNPGLPSNKGRQAVSWHPEAASDSSISKQSTFLLLKQDQGLVIPKMKHLQISATKRRFGGS